MGKSDIDLPKPVVRQLICGLLISVIWFGVQPAARNSRAADSADSDVEGSTSGIFINPMGGVVSGVGTNFFTWGVEAGSPPSSLRYDGAAFSASFDELFSFGTLTFFNGMIQAGSEADAVDLQVTINLTMPSVVTKQLVQTLTLINTPNVGTPEQQADLVLLPASIPKIPFIVENVEYTLEFLGFGRISGEGGASTIDRFFVLEEGTASAELLGRITACGDPGFQLTQKDVPGTGKKLCYKANVSKDSLGSGSSVSFALDLKNPHPEPLNFVVCAMINTNAPGVDLTSWTASVVGGVWTAEKVGIDAGPPNFHFGCRSFAIPAGETRSWRDQGALPLSNRLDDAYIDFLKDFPVAANLDYMCMPSGPGCVRGENQYLVPHARVEGELYANYWASVWRMEERSPRLGVTMQWEVGNWVTMRDPDKYLARLNGIVIDAPTGSILTFQFPPGSPEPERVSVVPPMDPNNPTCLGVPLEVSEPFIIPPEPATLTLDVLVPDACSALREGSVVRFLGETVGEPGSPVFQPGEFIVGYAGTGVVDNLPPQVEQLITEPAGDGFLTVRLSATDATTAPLAALLRFRVDGGQEDQMPMVFDEPPIVGDFVLFRQTIGPFKPGSIVEISAEVFDDVMNSVISPPAQTTAPLQIDIKPGSFPNSVNRKNRATIPVAILSTLAFDAPGEVDQSSLTFGRTGDELSLAFCNPSAEDVNADGLPDQVCHFHTQVTNFQTGDMEGTLKGLRADGVPIEGRDSVRIVP